MSLTGIPLIILTLLAAAAAIVATVLLWSRYGRIRLVSRVVGVLLCEVLLVFSAGLIANRQQQFYPSWQALAGNTGTAATTVPPPAGTLDTSFGPGRLTVPWQPAGAADWHLASPARVTVPARYLGAHGSFPVLLALGGRPAPADLVAVSAAPTAKTTVAALTGLTAQLATGLRVITHGWALLAAPAYAPLAAALVRADPGRFSALVVVGAPPAGFRSPPDVVYAVARPAPAAPHPAATAHPHSPAAHPHSPAAHPHSPAAHPHSPAAHPHAPAAHPGGATVLTGSWAAATGWATGWTPPVLAAPEVLPTAAVPA